MTKKRKEGAAKSEDTLDKARQKEALKTAIFDDPTCIDGAITETDDDDDDDVVSLDWKLLPPILTVVAEDIICHHGKSSIRLTVQYEAQDDPDFEYEFSIEEVDA